ncbi:MAG: sigma 54-interacting transcriptional regulator [Minicystis sp.]
MKEPVLVSWIAFARDPYEKADARGVEIPGPTLAILTDPASEYAGKITDAVLLRQGGNEAAAHTQVYDKLVEALAERCPTLGLHPIVWEGHDPTDHAAIFEFLREKLPEIRRKFPGRELVIHMSPGTPSMHTVWVLMAETGFIERPFRLVQTLKPEHRRGRPAVVPVEIGIDTFYRRYQETRIESVSGSEESVRWDPARFVSPALMQVFQEARRVAPLRIPVLIVGERGTGKSTLAAWIRAASPYRRPALDQSWPVVACGQYERQTMRAELFGYKKGAFTDAREDREGLLHKAHKDTLFLDEIGDVARDVQRLLIKAIEEGSFQRLGSTEPERSDFRLVTATNLPLHVLEERLDADFFDRIRAYVLRLPPLREVRDDLGWMWDATLIEAARRARVAPRWVKLSERERTRLVAALRADPLPGNMRDVFRVAWRYLAARADNDAPLPPSEAVDYALGALAAPAGGLIGDQAAVIGDQPRALARAFAGGQRLPASVVDAGPIKTEALFDAQQVYLAGELRRLAKERGLAVEKIADIGERTLRNWARKNPSGGTED